VISQLNPVLNNTKWDELRLAMHGLDIVHRWRTKDVSGYVSPWDRDWFYRFRDAGYESIEWAEIEVQSPAQDSAILAILRQIHSPGHRTDQGFRVYGYMRDGEEVDYI
jgi:hypothetical protein